MSTSAIIGMFLILGIVVGGFIFFLTMAIKNERKKER